MDFEHLSALSLDDFIDRQIQDDRPYTQWTKTQAGFYRLLQYRIHGLNDYALNRYELPNLISLIKQMKSYPTNINLDTRSSATLPRGTKTPAKQEFWRTSMSFVKLESAQAGAPGIEDEYNGLDFMLCYNLLRLDNNDPAPLSYYDMSIVVKKNPTNITPPTAISTSIRNRKIFEKWVPEVNTTSSTNQTYRLANESQNVLVGYAANFTLRTNDNDPDDIKNREDGYSEPEGTKYHDQSYVFNVVRLHLFHFTLIKLGKSVLDSAWEGYNTCLFAYGQTGSGKSYSMVGYGANKGIVPMACDEIFRRIKENKDPEKTY
jgi:hypothetical protein